MTRRDQPLLRRPPLSASEAVQMRALLARCAAAGLARYPTRTVSEKEARALKQAQVYRRRKGER